MVFFRGEYVFRSMNAVLAVLVLGTFGGVFLRVSSLIFMADRETLSLTVGWCFVVGGALFLGASVYVLVGIILGRRDRVMISDEGITYGRQTVPWREISEFYGISYSNGVSIGYTPANRKIYIERELSTTPLLTVAAYVALAETIRDAIHIQHAHVRIDTIPRQPTGD